MQGMGLMVSSDNWFEAEVVVSCVFLCQRKSKATCVHLLVVTIKGSERGGGGEKMV